MPTPKLDLNTYLTHAALTVRVTCRNVQSMPLSNKCTYIVHTYVDVQMIQMKINQCNRAHIGLHSDCNAIADYYRTNNLNHACPIILIFHTKSYDIYLSEKNIIDTNCKNVPLGHDNKIVGTVQNMNLCTFTVRATH